MCFTCLSFFSAAFARKFSTVVIDPGHGGKDIGGNFGKVYEKHLALDTSLRLEHYLKGRGYRVRMTRKSDVFHSLGKRVAIGNRYSNSIFVSIHYNYTWKKSVRGIETFYYSSRSERLARYVQAGMLKAVKGCRNRGAKRARYYVIKHAKNPAILVECGFISSSYERSRMRKAWFRQGMAVGIGKGIERYQYARKKGWAK